MLASKQLQYSYNSFSACLIAIAIIVLATFYIDVRTMEVLLEYKGSRRLIQVLDISKIHDLLQSELNKVGWRGVILRKWESSDANSQL